MFRRKVTVKHSQCSDTETPSFSKSSVFFRPHDYGKLAFSKSGGFGDRFHRTHKDGKSLRINDRGFKKSGYMM